MLGHIVVWQPGETMEQLEERVILEAIRFYDGSNSKAAEMLGITHATILNKLKTWQARDREKAINERAMRIIREKATRPASGELPGKYQNVDRGAI